MVIFTFVPSTIYDNNRNIVSIITQNYVVTLRSNQTFCQEPYKNVNSWFLKHVWQWKSFTSFIKGGEVSRRSMWQLVQNESDHIVYNIIFNQHNEDTFYYKKNIESDKCNAIEVIVGTFRNVRKGTYNFVWTKSKYYFLF